MKSGRGVPSIVDQEGFSVNEGTCGISNPVRIESEAVSIHRVQSSAKAEDWQTVNVRGGVYVTRSLLCVTVLP